MTLPFRCAVLSAVLCLACSPEEVPPGGGGGGGGIVSTRVPVAREVPLLGGTVTTAGGGDFAVVSDPERDLVHVIDVKAGRVRGVVRLPTGSQPTRGLEDPQGNVRVVLRGTGQIATIGLSGVTLIRTDSVCPEPRGLAWNTAQGALIVACASGELVTLPTVGSSTVRRLDADLRDVVVTNGRVRVSTFRSARLLDLRQDQVTPLDLPSISLPDVRGERTSFEPEVAWRTVPGPGNLTVTVHQRAVTGDIDAIRAGLPPVTVPYYTNPCANAVVRSALTVADDTKVLSSIEVGAVLPVDVAVSPAGDEVAVVSAGTSEVLRLPLPTAMGGISGGVCGPVSRTPPPPDVGGRPSDALGQPVGVAYVADGALLVHSRSPASVVIIPPSVQGARAQRLTLKLEGYDAPELPGYRLLHTSTGGLACASCHPEGQEDGHVWTFFAKRRRTQPLSGGLSQTAPFHWRGNLNDMNSLLGDTYVARMGGAMPTPVQVSQVSAFLDGLAPPKPPTRETPVDMTKGRAAFEKAGCDVCHSGAKLTNRATMDVGTGDAFQVPSLIGLSRRAPFMHDGCAKTIADRFDPACGGSSHGDVFTKLSKAEFDELVAYLGQL
jgi:DNA-binding beta-propeller fold protein YncE